MSLGDAGERPAVLAQREQRALDVVDRLRRGRIGEPAGTERSLVVRAQRLRVEVGRGCRRPRRARCR